MSKISNYVKKHKIFTAFLCLVLLFVLVWSGGRIYKIYYPNQAYYGTDFMYNGEAYVEMDDNWKFLEEPKKKLCKVYKSANSVLPSSTLYGFEDDTDHMIIRRDHPLFLAPFSYIKKTNSEIFSVNCIDKIVVELWDYSKKRACVNIELNQTSDLVLWNSFIQELQKGEHKKSVNHDYDLNTHSVYFYVKGVPHARYWVAEIDLEKKIIEVDQTGPPPQYILPDEFINMISNAKEIPVTEVY